MKRLILSLLLFSSHILANPIKYEVEEVVIDSRIIRFISAFIEYESVCEFYDKEYPKDNILSFNMNRSPLHQNDSAMLTPVIEFYPDNIRYHEYTDVSYVAHINVNDSIYNVYILMDEAVKRLWPHAQFPLPIKSTGNYETVIKWKDSPYGEYDPPFIRVWYMTNKNKTKNGFFVEDGFSDYCW